MKKIGTYTMRGRMIADSDSNRILLFDGSFKTGYRVTDFIISSADPNAAAGDCNAKLTTEATTSQGWQWDDNTQIAWAVSENRVTNAPSFGRSIVDPDNLIVQDLFIQNQSADSSGVNYMIYLDKYDITDWQGALAMVRNSAQNVG
jgi:hypothetical protein